MAAAITGHDSVIISESNDALRKGGLAASLMGFSAFFILIGLQMAGLLRNMLIPSLWALCGGVIMFLVFLLAARKLIHGWVAYLAVVFFILMPSSLFILAEFLLPAGAATYLSGPASYIYYFFIILTGFFFNTGQSILAGALSAAIYALFIFISKDELALLRHPDILLTQDYTTPAIYYFKAQMMLFSGFAMGFLATNIRRLINRILKEEHEKEQIDRLFGQYVSPEVKSRLLSLREDTRGEKKDMAVLFSDIRSYTTISEAIEPEKVVLQLNEYLEAMVKVIVEHGGVIDKFIGDAIMATFGGLLDLENPSLQAVKAAFAMNQTVKRLNKGWLDRDFPPLATGIGIHYGPALMGSIGAENRKEFTVIGDTVNVAARLESLSKEYQTPIMVSAAVKRNIPDGILPEPENKGEIQLKGRAQHLEIFGYRGDV